ncbi:MAG: bifunctional homocysteine S-methyltransferase/methylenetetrahydrofolate reductase [Thermoguttaceae bacterium]|nr:bifunctional homocysteine S-methyltransferase/methylenetetrahydrofolate reductase [Thermoguttaceae bacterium]
MGTEIYRNHIFTNRCFDELNLSMPQLIRRIHQSYVNAGADVITTNTFGANRAGLEKYGLADKTAEINKSGAALARTVAIQPDAYTHRSAALVAGSVGPILSEGKEYALSEAAEILAEQVAALREGGVDFILFETIHTPEQAAAALGAVDRAGKDIPYMLSFVPPERDGELAETLRSLFDVLETASRPPFAAGLNCGRDPAEMIPAVEAAMKATRLPLVVQPNAGYPKPFEGRQLYYCSPEYIATYAMEYLNLGVAGIGGCCGTTAEHIAEIAKMIRPLAKSHDVRVVPSEEPAAPPRDESPLAGRTKLAEKLVRRRWIRTVELIPPCGYDLEQTMTKVRRLAEFGVDAVNIPDGPRASARISNVAVAERILSEIGLEPILHFCCRDRNLIGMQSELLACALYKIRNILFITGDPPKLGNYPNATGVFDTDAIGLCELQTRLNRGIDLGGGAVDPPTDAVIGVGLDPTALNRPREIDRFRRKIDAGAHFAITQPVFDSDALLRFLDEIGELPIPIVAGVWPLTSYRNAVFMGNEVPGVVIPAEVMRRMEEASGGSKEDQMKVGIEIAREAIERIRPRVGGVQVSAPFGRVELSMEVMAE